MSVLAQKNILVGVTGGIAAYKVPFLVRQLIKLNCNVKVVMTPNSKEFVTPLTLSTVSKNDVYSEFSTEKNGNPTWNNHVELSEWADIFIIAPATSNSISSMANAKCDNILLACYLSSSCPVFIAPAMDLEMYRNSLNQENIKKLVKNRTNVLPVGKGSLASGLEGEGRMLEAERLTQSLMLDITSVTDLGLLLGAGIAARWKGPLAAQVSLPTRLWIVGALAALLMGYASRLAYGCNVGAFFSGISTGSLHGWVWFIAAFAGSLLGVRLRNHLLEEKR